MIGCRLMLITPGLPGVRMMPGELEEMFKNHCELSVVLRCSLQNRMRAGLIQRSWRLNFSEAAVHLLIRMDLD
jgi:hypothetical protein